MKSKVYAPLSRKIKSNTFSMNFNKKSNLKRVLILFFILITFFSNFISNTNLNINTKPKEDFSYDKDLRSSNQENDIFKLIFGTSSGPYSIDPQDSWDTASFNVIDQVCEGLFTYNLTDPNLQIIPHLATSKGTWMINSTDTWYTVSLRSNVLFHDGIKFNATAVKFTFDRLSYFMNVSGTLPQEKTITQIASLYKYFDPDLGTHLPIVNDTVIIDEYTIRFELNRPYGPFEALLCFPASYILSPTSTPQFDYINITSGDLVGTGPFVYEHYLIDNEVKFHAFDNYWAGKANITILKYSIINNAITRNNALLSGEVDLLIDPQPSMYSALDADPDVRLIDAGNTATIYPLQMSNYHINVTFRNAISYAINYSYIINELYGGNAVRLKSPLPENILFANWSLDVAIYNVTKAREIMQSMGFGLTWDTTYPGTDESLWSAATFASFNYTYNLGNQFREDTLMLLEDNLDKIGIEVIDAGMDWSEYLERMFYNGVEGWKKLQLFWSGWLPDFNDPSNYINNLLTNRTLDLSKFNTALYDGYSAAIESGRDPFNLWDNVQLLMEAALNETNQNIRKLYYDRIQKILVEEDMPWAYCFVPRNYDAYRSHILGFQSNAMGILKFYGVTQNSTIAPNTIYIDGNQEWLFFKNASKCTGQGTSSDPYVIEDLVIDGRNKSVSCIRIENSDVHFRIENCTLNNSTDAGIKLINTTNGQIIDNNCSNNGVGINLYNLNTNFNITGNNINDNSEYGILVNNSNSILIYNNSFIANSVNAFESVLSNSWDNGSIGNYWDDYSGADENDDGIGDSSYPIPGPTVSQDNFPLFEDGIDQGDNIFKLVFGTGYGPSNLDPHVAWDSASFDVITQVCEGLFKYKISDPNLPVIPNLATSVGAWMINSTDTWYTVSLRSDVFFHDGTKFNATAVKFTFDRLKYFINNSMATAYELYEYYDPDLGTNLPIINNTVIVDEFTIRFELNKPYGVFEHLLCFPGSSILSPTSTPQFDVINTSTGDLVGTGPFVYDYYIPDIEVKFHAFENYWAGRANITILKFSIINDAVTRNNALLSGDIDLLVDPLTSMFSVFESNPDITLVNAGQGMIIQYLGMNNQMINNTWRKAISYAINYSYIINELYGGHATRLKSPIPENMPYANWSFDIATFNISKAREIMQSMGFGIGWDTTYPGTNEAQWSAATFRTYNYTYNIGNTLRENILVLLQDNLDKIGIEVTDAGMTWTDFVYRLYEISTYTRNMLELFWLAWGPDYCDPSNFINPLFTNRSIATNGVQYNGYTAAMGAGRDPYDPWDNVQLLMEAAIFETDPNARNAMYQRIQQLLVEEDIPWAFGFIAHNYDVYRSHILGFQSNAMGILSFYDVTQDSSIAPQTISIDGNQEWQYLKNEGICTGQGTSVEPYVIEDLIINGQNNSLSCIHIENSDVYFRIENCTIYNSTGAGIKLINASNGYIIGNNCSYNGVGIYLDNYNSLIVNNYNISDNRISYNIQYGLILNNASNILVFNNNFTANGVNAFENWTSNSWDNGTIGNYWDDYGGVDANDDGIGDTPYLIPGSTVNQDNFPIWDDGIESGPTIIINAPISYSVYGITSPSFNVEINDTDGIDTMWYTLDGGVTNITFIANGTIDQAVWNTLANGTVNITFYANDTLGNLASTFIIVRKDIIAPSIIINSPISNELFGALAPTFNVEITDFSGVDMMWYSLDAGFTNFAFITNGTIDQAEWDTQGNGTVTISFYANDTVGNLAFSSVIVRKDIEIPDITINSPLPNELFGFIAPSFNVEIMDSSGIDTMWYTLDGGLANFTFITNGTIDQTEWNNQANGIITITFYANDTVGNIAYSSIIVRKDVIAPNIIINSPANNTYWNTPPTINIIAFDPNLHTIWYRVGTTDIMLLNNTNQLFDQSIWDSLPVEGEFLMYIFANDSVGNLNNTFVLNLFKDTKTPTITIDSPNPNELFGVIAPSVSLTVQDTYLEEIWYQLSNGTVITNNYTWTGFIDQVVWDQVGNGTVTIIFFANDTVGNLANNSVVVRKDIEAPDITINSPLPNELFGFPAPIFTVEISDINGVDMMWYTLDGGLTNLTFIANGTIDQIEWDAQLNGTVTIIFYANDMVGNLASNLVVVRKDIEIPYINIISPLPNELFGYLAPNFNVEIADSNGIDTMWYTLDGGLTNITFITNGTIDQIEWDAQLNGTVTILFYANDTVGNLASNSVVIRKDIEIPDITINSPLPNELFGSLTPPFNVEITDSNGIDKMWYTLDGGLTNFTFITNGTIDQIEWNTQLNGTVTITFYANDTLGNVASNSIVVRKDIEIPDITINSPLPNELFGSLTPPFNVEITDINGIDAMWYTLDGGLTNFTFITNGTMDQIEWNAHLNGTVTITFYANDTIGNLAFNSVVVRKDIEIPDIAINSPLPNELFGSLTPSFNVEITDINGIDAMWYTLDGGLTNITFITNGTIDQIEWNAQLNGTVTITFYANDTVGNIASNSIVVRKDIEGPSIIINSPISNELFGSLAPSFNVEITDSNGIDTMWYTLDGGITNFTFITNGTIDQIEWNTQLNGTVTITFYANDTLGNVASNSIVVRKDIEIPDITINSPIPNELFGSLAPSFNVEITDSNGIDTMWYTLDGGITNFTFITNGTIDQIEWNAQLNGTVTITFYTNDTIGNTASNFVIIRKDIEIPDITINLPLPNELFGSLAPNFTVEITDINGIDTMWYTLNGGITNFTFINNGTIDQIEWNAQLNGTVTITFYANDTLGNIAFNSVVVRKDIGIPYITINLPLPNELFGSLAPNFTVEITDSNGINTMWYTLDGGLTNLTFITNGTIDQIEWDNQLNGTVTITFYANDTLGNIAFNSVVVRKDIEGPSIIINSPLPNGLFGSLAPTLNVEIIDSNGIDAMWYTLDAGLTNFTLITNGTIDQIEWDAQANGTVTITFYANDTLGNLASNSIVIRKDILSGPTILINTPASNSLFGYSPPDYNVELTAINGLDKMWYTLDGGLTNLTFINNGTIDQIEWDAQLNGTVTITFYANDTLGNVASNSIVVRKDIEIPDITINSPIPNELFGPLSPSFNVEITDINGIDTMWYTLDGGLTNLTFITNGTIDQIEWGNKANGTLTIAFYANDTVGNLASYFVVIRKDIEIPDITINLPLPNELFGSLAPSFNVEITDINGINTMWYTLNGGLTNFTFIANGTIDQIEWNGQLNGTVTISFYANDTLGNLAFNSIVVRKDVLSGPTILVNTPTNNSIFGYNPPNFNVEISNINGVDTMWYTLDGGITNITFIANGTIDQTEWDAHGNGTVTIRFYSNNTLGKVSFMDITVRKDIEIPVITIHTPEIDEIFQLISPDFNISITEINLDFTWYSLSNNTYVTGNFTFTGLTGKIDQGLWDNFINGSIEIFFYAIDKAGNIGFQNVTVMKLPEYYSLEATVIDDTGAGNYTWGQAKAQEWCYGSGTWNDPYIIEFLIINGHNAGSNLIIRNSSVFFIIRKSILYNSGGKFNDAGLKLEHVSNAILINLDCSNNNGHGIYLYDCQNITIMKSNMNHNKLAGIFLRESSYNFILNNTETINYNHWGIYFLLSHSNTIGGSYFGFNQIGLLFEQSNNNLITHNFFNRNDEAYVEKDSYGNTFQGNTVITKPDILIVIIITAVSLVSISGVSFVIVRQKVIIPKKGRKIKVYDKKKFKVEEKLHNRLLAVDYLIEEKNVKEALKDLAEIKDLCKVYGLFEILNECDEKVADCNCKYLEMINIIKRIVLNLATKFARLEIVEISEQAGIRDEDFIVEVLQEMIQNNEINGEYFSKSKAVAFDKQSNIEQIEQFIKIYREWEMLNLERDDSELLLEEIRSEELKPKAIVSKLLPEKVKELKIFLSYSTMDIDHFQILKVVKSLEEYPEIDKVMYWEPDKLQEVTDYKEFMDETLNEFDVFLLFCSENSMKSASVKDEWQIAFEKREQGLIKIIPVYDKLDKIPVILGHILSVNYDKTQFDNFIKNLYQEIMRSRGNRIS